MSARDSVYLVALALGAVMTGAGCRTYLRGRVLDGVVLSLSGAGATCVALVLGPGPAGPGGAAASSAAAPAQHAHVPERYLRLYRDAADRYGLDWAIVAAIGEAESDHGRAALPGVSSGRNRWGAAGPAQFVAATWSRFGMDGNGDGRADVYDPADAIPAMARYLRASGAPHDWRRALRAYNDSGEYVDRILTTAAGYRDAEAGAAPRS